MQVFGETLCHVVPMALAVSVYVSTLTSTAIAIERYFIIVHPFKSRLRISFGVALIAAIWIVSISVSLPLAIYQEVSINVRKSTCDCLLVATNRI